MTWLQPKNSKTFKWPSGHDRDYKILIPYNSIWSLPFNTRQQKSLMSMGIGDFFNSLETNLTCPRVKICSHQKSSFTHPETPWYSQRFQILLFISRNANSVIRSYLEDECVADCEEFYYKISAQYIHGNYFCTRSQIVL